MKHLIACGISLILVPTLHAQINHFEDSVFSSMRKNNYFGNIYNLQQKNTPRPDIVLKKIEPVDPSVLQLPKPDLTFIRNYNHADIYQSMPDNMFVTKPDSSFISNMPVADNNKSY